MMHGSMTHQAVVTCDKTRLFQYDPETKDRSTQRKNSWISKTKESLNTQIKN